MLKLTGAVVLCAAVAFAAAFFAAGAARSQTKRTVHHKPVAFADPTAHAVAVSLSGAPAALKLPPPPPRHKHHPSHPAVTAAAQAPTATPAPSTSSAPHYTEATPAKRPAPTHHASHGGSGTGVTIVGG